MPTDSRHDAYIDRAADFARPILVWLRARIHAAVPEVEETIKWGMPSFYLKGRPLATMAAFKAHATFGFWNHEALLKTERPDAMGSFGRITSLADLPSAPELEALIRRAAEIAESGAKPARARPQPRPEAEVPDELAEALAADDAAAETFRNFPPSCRREYCEWIAEAKRPETRAKRVAEAVGWMREGKRRNWKYESC
ncbi:YdeI/OmpD-associated family protein [Sphingomonas sp.]|uniref:YdeI/OmpD-associated family protein n=1 Tax=Sphingomonas sp. TaxID=28214 RepID=UPI001AFFF429|nr:YdeI/OmpD-associated family protein [Sphingomonas sp.]MBO9714452.1 YdeI/OmpD-associated family protein [Sphingomonas sp.]